MLAKDLTAGTITTRMRTMADVTIDAGEARQEFERQEKRQEER